MTQRRPRKPRPPLSQALLNELALAYVGRFATTRAKLASYLERKLRERGWAGPGQADVNSLVARFASSGLVDDSAFALAKAQSLARRGYGKRRLTAALRGAGVGDDGAEAYDHANREAASAALRFAERRRIGPFAAESVADRRLRDKQVAAMVRAGHSFALALAILSLSPGAVPDPEELAAEL
jgi:regulatory protein